MAAVKQQRAPRRVPQRMSLRDELAHEHSMHVVSSTSTAEILERKDGIWTERLIYLGYEYADKKLAFMAKGGAK